MSNFRTPPPSRPSGRGYAWLSAIVLALLLALAQPPVQAQSADPNRAVAIAKKLELLQRYLASGNSRKITAGANDTAKGLLRRAEERASTAMKAYEMGDMRLAEERMDEAFRSFTAAVDAARVQGAGNGALKQRNAEIRGEIRSYLQAFEEALRAKGPAAAGLLNRQQVDDLIGEADRLESAGQSVASQAKLKEAYSLAVTALTRIRQNETVVYTLDFRTPADEFRYEQQRFQSYTMLLTQLRGGSELGQKAAELAERYAGEGIALREQAEAEAAAGKFETAIKTLEEANRRLTRALQMMGLSIPG